MTEKEKGLFFTSELVSSGEIYVPSDWKHFVWSGKLRAFRIFFFHVVYKPYIISVNCQWSSWSRYSGCTKSCGGGTQFTTRTKTIPESDGGTCSGEKVYSRNCNVQSCPGKFTKVEYMFLTVGQNNFGNKILFLIFPLGF